MTYVNLLTHIVTITNPQDTGVSDIYGNDQQSSVTTSELALIQPVSDTEDIINRDTRVTRYKMFFLKDSSVTGLSTITWESRIIRVNGEPRLHDYGTIPHLEADGLEYNG